MDRTREREESKLFHRKRVIKRLVKRKPVKYQFCVNEESWTLDFFP